MTVATDQAVRSDLEAIQNHVNIDEFLDWYPENSTIHYELRRGAIIERLLPRGKHTTATALISPKSVLDPAFKAVIFHFQ